MATALKPRVSNVATGAGLAGLIGVLTPVWATHRAVSRVRTARTEQSTVDIPRASLTDRSLNEIMDADRPVIVTDLIDRVEFRRRPDVAGLRELAADHEQSFAVKVHRRDSPYFLYVGDYGAELERVERLSLDEFLDRMFVTGPADGTCTYRLFSIADLDGAVGGMIDDIVAALEPLTDRRADRQASGVWVGSEGVVTPLHHDAWTGILLQLDGSKRVAMYSPTDRANLSFVSPFAPTERWSTLPPRSAEADPDEHPLLAHTTRHEARLDAGEALYIPPYWSHEVEALEANISIPFRFGTRPVDYLNPGFLRPAVEVFHKKYVRRS
jgi:hypothetical protein